MMMYVVARFMYHKVNISYEILILCIVDPFVTFFEMQCLMLSFACLYVLSSSDDIIMFSHVVMISSSLTTFTSKVRTILISQSKCLSIFEEPKF